MKNLKEERLGLAYTNLQGHRCVITAYNSNKDMVVHDEVTDKYLRCRWVDLRNPKCKAVYNPMLAVAKEVVAKEAENKSTEVIPIKFRDTIKVIHGLPSEELSDKEDKEEKEGLSAALFVIGVGIVIVGVLLWAIL